MLIAQITDIHLGFEPENPGEYNRHRLDKVLETLIDGPNRPDLLLATGDLVDRGDPESYAQLQAILADCPFPVVPCMGNHDDRDNFLSAFPDTPTADGFVQYVVALDGLRLIILDTLEPGRHGGAFCERRAAWLAAQLSRDSDTPVVIIMHHPPLEVGIDWMNTHNDEAWVRRFAETIAGHTQIRALLCGHLHRVIVAPWKGVTMMVCPSTAPQVALDLNPIDPDRPDGRAMIVAEHPGYALHRWTGEGLVSHFDTARDHPVLAVYDEKMESVVRSFIAEWPVGQPVDS